jgi:hypothetical protein
MAVIPEIWLNVELRSWFDFLLVKGIAAAENLRYIVQLCGAGIILSKQAWMWWNSVGKDGQMWKAISEPGTKTRPPRMKIRFVHVPLWKRRVTLSRPTSTDRCTFRSVLLVALTAVNWIAPASLYSCCQKSRGARHPTLSLTKWIKYMPPHPNHWMSILILSSPLCQSLPIGLFPSARPRRPHSSNPMPVFSHLTSSKLTKPNLNLTNPLATVVR